MSTELAAPALAIDELCVEYVRGGTTTTAVREVSLTVAPGECLGVVGESGSGKSQIFLAAMGLLASNAHTRGSVRFFGKELLCAPRSTLDSVRGSKLTMVFQDPLSALTPHLKIGAQLAELLVCHRGQSWREAREAALAMLRHVGISDAQRRMQQYPHELSGGMRQRVLIGMSLLCEPDLLIADEPTTALDVTVQAQVLELLRMMRRESRLGIVLISHDFGLVAGLADRIVVLYAGRVVESAPAAQLFARPRHPYAAALIQCSPAMSGFAQERMPTLAGQPPDPADRVEGCAFAPRCSNATPRCRAERPLLQTVGAAAQLACHNPCAT
jgi:oligopeptide transport system ATP-binding protein